MADPADTRADILDRLAAAIASRRNADPATSYVAALMAKGDDAVLKKIGEEATETVMAAKDGDKLRITAEVADLWFHCLVLLERHGLGPDDVRAELARREGTSGIAEKASRKTVATAAGADGSTYGGGRNTETQRCRTAFSARSCGARSPRERSTRTTKSSASTTSIR